MNPIHVLLVVDGNSSALGFNYAPSDTTDDTFTIAAYINALETSTDPVITVTKAHRNADPHADIQNFNFYSSVPDLSAAYDVIVLIGYEGSNYTDSGTLIFITDDELIAISNFMQNGGGVLATGDHDGLGSLMSGMIPRVRSMRSWFAESDDDPRIPAAAPRNWPGGGANRADTLQPDHHGEFNFDNQSDNIPQPLTFPGGTVHPILMGPSGPLTGYPDHMHEGEVITPWTYTDTLSFVGTHGQGTVTITEYPTVGGYQEQPVIIAQGNVIGGHETPVEGSNCEQENFAPALVDTVAKTINILCTYDGHNVGVGRIVTDSSFHHYADLNIIGDPCAASTTGDFKQQGFSQSSFLQQMQAFYVNTIIWLDRLEKTCTLTTDRSTFGKDEVNAALHQGVPAVIQNAFYVTVDGCLHEELNITAATLTGIPNVSPTIAFSPTLSPAPAGQVRLIATSCAVDGGVLLNTPQRFTWTYSLQFFDVSDFTATSRNFVLTASITPTSGNAISGQGMITFTDEPNPYETDGPTSWLSVDLQVFNLRAEGYLAHTPGIRLTGTPTSFIADLLSNSGGGYNDPALARAPLHPFDLDLVANEDNSTVEWAGTVPNPIFPFLPVPVYNFAIARVRYRALATPANNVRVFFRMFQASTTDTSFQPTTTYLTGGVGATKVPLLGVVNGEVVSIPFFAAPRVSPSNPQGLNAQPDPINQGPDGGSIPPDASGAEVQVYFGCWLDINQNVAQLPDPNQPASASGPYTPVQTIQQAIMGKHQCLVAEINMDPPEPGIITGTTPSNSDKLAQRNLTIVGAASPHQIPVTFDIRPTIVNLPLNLPPDELMINWQGLPITSEASIYLPGLQAAKILSMADQLYTSHGLSSTDEHTLTCKARGITYIPIPEGVGSNYAGLLTVSLPDTIRREERFSVLVQQITNTSVRQPIQYPDNPAANRRVPKEAYAKEGRSTKLLEWREILGSFQLDIPVTTREQLLDPEERLLAVARWVALTLPASSRWYPVFSRYLDVIAGRVKALGGNPTLILPSSSGYSGAKHHPVHPVHPGHGGHPAHGEEELFYGKIEGLIYDLFGDFEGFVLKTVQGGEQLFRSREPRMEELMKYAWRERITVRIVVDRHRKEVPLTVTLL